MFDNGKIELKTDNNLDTETVKTVVSRFAPVTTLVIMMLLLTILNNNFLSFYNLDNLLSQVATLLVISIGATFVILIGSIDLSVGAISSASAVVTALLIGKYGYWAFPVALALGAFAGLLNGVVFTKLKIPSFITTLGTNGLWLGFSYTVSKGAPVQILRIHTHYLKWATDSTFGFTNLALVALIMLLIAYIIEEYTSLGRYIFAIGAGEAAARASGVRITRVKTLVFVFCGFCSGLTGILLAARLFSGAPSVGNPFGLLSIAAVVVGGTALTGGIGSVARTLIGALIMSVLSNGMNIVGIDAYWQQVVTGIIVIIAVCLTIDRKKIPVIK